MKVFKGVAGAPGIVSGKTLYYEKKLNTKERTDIDTAINKALEKVRELERKALDEFGEDKAKIFTAYEMLLEDKFLTDPIRQKIDEGCDEIEAITDVTESMASVLALKDNEYMRQRADDIRYVGNILKDAMCSTDDVFSFPEGDDKYILAAHELTPVDTVMFDKSRLAGIVTELGGATSHTVILAKSMGIPAVVGAENIMSDKESGLAYLDGYKGVFAINPDSAEVKVYEKKLQEEIKFKEQILTLKQSQAETKDGEKILVAVNIGNPSDIQQLDGEKINGVGLFRTEFLYSSLSEKPTVQEQTNAYKKVIDAVYPEPVTVRTIDVGGDKQISYLNMKFEENPFLGNRGIRLSLKNPEVFSEQLEALLIAGEGKKVKIMLPMVTVVDEIFKAKAILSSVRKDLEERGIKYCTDVSLGIMVETPACAVMADVFSKYCDFFSIGTNDLVQYVTASDRGNSDVKEIYSPYNPAVLRLINNVIKEGEKNKMEVSICGDLAANTEFTELLLGMGLKKFSVPIPSAGRIKHKISTLNLSDAQKIADMVLKAENEQEVKNILEKENS